MILSQYCGIVAETVIRAYDMTSKVGMSVYVGNLEIKLNTFLPFLKQISVMNEVRSIRFSVMLLHFPN